MLQSQIVDIRKAVHQSFNRRLCLFYTLSKKLGKISSHIIVFWRDQIQVIYDEEFPNIWGKKRIVISHVLHCITLHQLSYKNFPLFFNSSVYLLLLFITFILQSSLTTVMLWPFTQSTREPSRLAHEKMAVKFFLIGKDVKLCIWKHLL